MKKKLQKLVLYRDFDFLVCFFLRIEDGESWRVAVEPTNYKKVKNKWQSITLPSLNVNKGKSVPPEQLKQAKSKMW